MPKLPRVEPGDPITADLFNQLLAIAEGCNLVVGPGLQVDQGGDGAALSLVVPESFTARITGPLDVDTYPWIEVFPDADGTWADGSRTGDAFERNANADVPEDLIVDMRWVVAGWYTFDAGGCS
jgi:hypothetical protein